MKDENIDLSFAGVYIDIVVVGVVVVVVVNFTTSRGEVSKMTQKPMWYGERPAKCDLCDVQFKSEDHFIDGRTVYGPWGIMCVECHAQHGCGLGTGKGQRYSWDTLEKVEG